MKCPICNGSGQLKEPLTSKTKKEAVLVLINNGFGQRMTQRLLGYKSPRSISMLLKNITKNLQIINFLLQGIIIVLFNRLEQLAI